MELHPQHRWAGYQTVAEQLVVVVTQEAAAVVGSQEAAAVVESQEGSGLPQAALLGQEGWQLVAQQPWY